MTALASNDVFDQIAQTRQKRADEDRARYLVLARKLGTSGALTPAEAQELDQLTGRLQYPIERVKQDAKAVAEYQTLKREAATVEGRRKAFAAAAAAHKRQESETDEIVTARRADATRLRIAAEHANMALRNAEQAEEELSHLVSDFGRDLLNAPSPQRTAAYLLDNRIDVADEFSRLAGNANSDTDRAKVREDRAAALAAIDKLEKSIPEGATVFHLTRRDLSGTGAITLDPDAFDFRPLKGQPVEQFHRLHHGLLEAIAAQARR